MATGSLTGTPRRSKRFQPIVGQAFLTDVPPKKRAGRDEKYVWAGESIHKREVNPEIDLLPDERDEFRESEEEEGTTLETVFFDAFERQIDKTSPKKKQLKKEKPVAVPVPPTTPTRARRGLKTYTRKARREAKEALEREVEQDSEAQDADSETDAEEDTKRERIVETFKVGDTVFIQTHAKLPSIAVIIAMWQTQDRKGKVKDEPTSMKLRVRWFLRPTELPSIRAKRVHKENEIYLSLDSNDILLPSSVKSHCTVSSQTSPPETASTLVQGRSRGQGKKQSRYSAGSFYCAVAVDQRRGLFYEFIWEDHRRRALEEAEDTWDDGGTVWNVVVDDGLKKIKKEAAQVLKRALKVGSKKRRLDDEDDDENDHELPVIEEVSEEDDEDEVESALLSESDDEDESDDEPEEEEDEDSPEDEDDDDFDEPKTPSKSRKRKRSTTTTPRKPTAGPSTPRRPRTQRTLAQPTPHSKAALLRRQSKSNQTPTTPRKRKAIVRVPPTPGSHVANANLPDDPWLRAMHHLHVGSRPDVLEGREAEYKRILRSVGEVLEEGGGGCIYISGVPGTGKTATVHAVVRELKRMAEQGETNPFTFVEINGLRIPEPSAAYNLLWEGISGHDVEKEGHLRIAAKESLKALSRHFSGGGARGPGGHACVVLMDELDQLVTAKQDVVYNFFNWPTLAGSKLVVLAVANTMDLPERVMDGRVRSRLGMIRINFQPYNTPQLESIVQARLLTAKEGLKNSRDVIHPDGVKFAAMKVSSISGDARRVLDICRRTVELVQEHKRTANMADVREVIKVMQNSPTAAYLRECSFHERMMLASLVKCVKREGVEQIKWGDVQHQHIIYMNVLTSATDPMRRPTPSELSMVLDTLLASRAILVEDGVAISRKAEGERRIILNLEQTEVERVLSEVGGQRWKNVLCG